jgi:hypothetical protein
VLGALAAGTGWFFGGGPGGPVQSDPRPAVHVGVER